MPRDTDRELIDKEDPKHMEEVITLHLRPIKEKHYKLDSKIGHKRDRRENFLMNPTR